MTGRPQRPKGRDRVRPALDMAISVLNLAKEAATIEPAKAAVGSVAILLIMIRDTMANEKDYVELGLFCADICKALERGMNGKTLDDLSKSVRDAIDQLTGTVKEIEQKIGEQSGNNRFFRFLLSRADKDAIAGWKSDLNKILLVFNTELIMNTHTIVADTRRDVLKIREATEGQNLVTQSASGELPPPSPRIFFGRDELIEKIIGLAERLMPTALIGAGGIGKTSTALTVLHDDRIKRRFGDNRWFIRCDQFPASRAHFLRQLSKVIGAGIENPEDLTPLRRYLSSKEMVIVLDNAESILDPQETNGRETYAIVDELARFNTVCLCVTSRISTIPPDCETIEMPTLPMEAALDTFYRICKHSGQSSLVDDILERLDFHPLSVTLLATVAQHNKWDADRLSSEWKKQRTEVLCVQNSGSLATTIELSLASPMFRELGPDARELLGVVAFFPQGVDEKNVDWLFPTISDGRNSFDKFCILSLTYRSNGFITMLAPLRDYLRPKDPTSSSLLGTTKERYFTRLSASIYPGEPGFEESRWITSEDVNIEHLLDVFTSIDANSKNVFDSCAKFMEHLDWHKPRFVTLGPKIEALPDDHPSKAQCLENLSWLFYSVGNQVERKRLLTHTLELVRVQGDDYRAALILSYLSDANRVMGLSKEGIKQAKEASETLGRLGRTVNQALCLIDLALVLCEDEQLDAAEEAASRAIDLLPEKGEPFLVCEGHIVLGVVYCSKRKTEEAIHHFELALRIGSSHNLVDRLFRVHLGMGKLFFVEGRYDDTRAHVECAKSHAVNSAYRFARASWVQAWVWKKQHRFEEARSEALCALDAFEKLGAVNDAEEVGWFLEQVDSHARGLNSDMGTPDRLGDNDGITDSERLYRHLSRVFLM